LRDLLGTLNPPQREAVLHGDGPLLVLAGAGSGKTRVLTHRIAHLIAERGVPPWAILAITFTNKAAGEMRERIGELVGPAAREIWASTFHSACVRILRREAEAAGFDPRFVIYDADDQQRLMRACMADEQVDPKRVAPRAVLARISDAKNRLLDPDGFADELSSFGDEVVLRLYRSYTERLRTAGAMDFDDLLMLTVRLLESDAAVRERYQRRFSHVLVDEYQDTNHAQYRLVRVLSEPQRNVCAVGDDDQGIYSWRGADVRNILDFERDYPDAHIVALEQNYRSTGTILRAANAVVALNRGRRPKELWTDRGHGEAIRVDSVRDEHEEARLVVSEVDRALAEGTSLSEIAVFYRTNAQSRSIEDQLVRSRIAYAVVGGPRFYERSEVRDLIAYLRVVANPADEIAIARMLGAPKRGIGPGCITKLNAFAAANGLAPAEAIAHGEMVSGLTQAQREALAVTAATLADLGQAAAAGLPLERLIEGTRRLAAQDFNDRIEIARDDEFSELAESFNTMTASIETLLQEREEKQRLEQELAIARRIQMSLLPQGPLRLPGIIVGAHCEPAREVGGDYYDFLPLGPTRAGILIADVAGKGTSAALYMAELKGLVLSLSRIYHSPKQLLCEVNHIISDNLDARSFITMTYAVIDLAAGTLTHARAGHTPLLYVASNGTPRPRAELLAPDGLVLGLRVDGVAATFERLLTEVVLPLRSGDVFVFFTDGITEAMNPDAELFGEDRLQAIVEEHWQLPADQLRERILREIESFVGLADQHDDMTMILIKVEDAGAALRALPASEVVPEPLHV